MSDLSLLWTIVSIILSVFGSVWLAAWRLKGHLTGAEMAGLREQNAAHTAWRGFEEAQRKQLAEQLAETRATIATLQRQIEEGAKKEVLANTAASSSRAIEHANSLLDMWGETVRTPITRRPSELTRKSSDDFGAWPTSSE
jgi:hypothetical protein